MSAGYDLIGHIAAGTARWSLLRQAGVVVAGTAAVALIVVLATANLELYPRTWFDEGSHLRVPKTLVQEGVYADRDAEGYRYFGPTTGVGPTVLLPIAGVFALAGVGLVQARLVMVAYLLLTLVCFALATRHLQGGRVAILATLLLLAAPGVDLLFLGRQVLGEVPALAFLMLGLLAWERSTRHGRYATRLLVLAALGLGLAALTKNQFGLILVPTLMALLVLDRVYYRALSPRFAIIPLAGVVGAALLGYVTQLLIAAWGTGDLLGMLRLFREASGGAIFVFAPARTLSSLHFLLGPDMFWYWGWPALLHGAFLARQRTLGGLHQAFLVTFIVVGLAWFALGSIGWPRYAFPALALTAILVARLFHDMAQALGRALPGVGPSAGPSRSVLTLALLTGVGLLVVVPLLGHLRAVLTTTDRGPQLVAAYLNEHVATSAVIATWEPELGFLTDHRYRQPPLGSLDRAVRARWLQGAGVTDHEPFAGTDTSYLVVGPFGKYTGVYDQALARHQPWRVVSIGEYDLYRRP
jgi:hypothetical protein